MSCKFTMLGLAILLAGTLAMLPQAKADEWNRETTVTFSSPVQIPGQVLPPGQYVFKLADNQADRHVVQIFTEGRELLTTILAIPAYRLKPTDDTVITFEERPTGNPEAVKRWFYPGELEGVGFVYPE